MDDRRRRFGGVNRTRLSRPARSPHLSGPCSEQAAPSPDERATVARLPRGDGPRRWRLTVRVGRRRRLREEADSTHHRTRENDMLRTAFAATAVALTSLMLVPGPANAAPCVKQLAYCVG